MSNPSLTSILNTKVSEDCFKIESNDEFLMIEKDNGMDYEITCKKSKDKHLICIFPSKIKQKSEFLIAERGIAKDCDYIVIDQACKKIFFIELNNAKTSATALEVNLQLEAGIQWLDHLLFTVAEPKLLCDYEHHKICCRFTAKMDKIPKFKQNEYGVVSLSGKIVDFRALSRKL